MNNIELFNIALKYPDGTVWQVGKLDPAVTFFPAKELSNNEAILIFNPSRLNDGVYELFVQSMDMSGNFAGTNAYEVTFQVVNEEAITTLGCYPNPSVDGTNFVFTMTGDILPNHLELLIHDVMGRLVVRRDITNQLRFGRNQIEMKWSDGLGHQNELTNGLYFYSLKSNENADSKTKRLIDRMNNRENKLVIIR